MKDFLDACQVDEKGCVSLYVRRVDGAVSDRFCSKLISQFKWQIDLSQFTPINGTNSLVANKVDGTQYMLPLCCEETLESLGITIQEIEELCRVATCYVRHTIDEIPSMDDRISDGHHPDWSALPAAVQRRMLLIQAA